MRYSSSQECDGAYVVGAVTVVHFMFENGESRMVFFLGGGERWRGGDVRVVFGSHQGEHPGNGHL